MALINTFVSTCHSYKKYFLRPIKISSVPNVMKHFKISDRNENSDEWEYRKSPHLSYAEILFGWKLSLVENYEMEIRKKII